MRLSVQSFERRFDPGDPASPAKLREFSESLIQQIDTMSNIASAFSNFAKMPAQQRETLNVVAIVKLALDIFHEPYILFMAEEEELIAKLDRTQLIRVVTNLVKNAIQAMEEQKNPKILVTVAREEEMICIAVQDNGVGISDENMDKIFEPKFTTKNSGMGLGLGMVRNIVENSQGSIEFTSEEGVGTTFKVLYPEYSGESKAQKLA
jgi:signal transduction histidine kinase